MSNAPRGNQRLGNLEESHIRRMTRECNRVGGINLGQGVCDLPTPPEILNATLDAIRADRSMYSPFEGIPELREQFARKLREYNRIPQADAGDNVIVTSGSAGAFSCVCQSLLDPGDEVLILEPFYGYHVNTLRGFGIQPIFVTMDTPSWTLAMDKLEDAVTPKTRAILINTPANPSGKVFTTAELEQLRDFCETHNLLAITDEIYEYIVYETPHVSLASIPGMWNRTVTISGVSKTFSITGWRLGYICAPPALAKCIGIANDLMYICAPVPLQYGLAQGMANLKDEYYRNLAADYRRKRDEFCNTLKCIGLTPSIPAGAYYVLADVTSLDCPDSVSASMHILKTAGIACVPGESFFSGNAGDKLVRFCYAKDWEILRQACEQLLRLS